MATYLGSGNWVRVENGILSMGLGSKTYGTIRSLSATYDNEVYYGFEITGGCFSLRNVGSLTVGNAKCYTGNVRMYTDFTNPYGLIWDPSRMDVKYVERISRHYQWINGFMVGEFEEAPPDWWDNIDWDDDSRVVPDDDYSDDQIEDEEPVISEDGGRQKRIVKYTFSAGSIYNESTRGFTEVSGGSIKFGYRNSDSLTRNYRTEISNTTYTYQYIDSHGQTKTETLYGTDWGNQKIKICQDYTKATIKLKLVGLGTVMGSTGATGYMRFISYVWAGHDGVDWKVEEWPFICGLCVVKRT